MRKRNLLLITAALAGIAPAASQADAASEAKCRKSWLIANSCSWCDVDESKCTCTINCGGQND